jgi:hypothetical protein
VAGRAAARLRHGCEPRSDRRCDRRPTATSAGRTSLRERISAAKLSARGTVPSVPPSHSTHRVAGAHEDLPRDGDKQLGTIQVEVDSRIRYVVVPPGGIRITPVAHPRVAGRQVLSGRGPRGTYHQVKVSSSGESWNFSSNRVDRPGRGGELETRRARHLPGGGLRSCLGAAARPRLVRLIAALPLLVRCERGHSDTWHVAPSPVQTLLPGGRLTSPRSRARACRRALVSTCCVPRPALCRLRYRTRPENPPRDRRGPPPACARRHARDRASPGRCAGRDMKSTRAQFRGRRLERRRLRRLAARRHGRLYRRRPRVEDARFTLSTTA